MATSTAPPTIDYDALAKQNGAISSEWPSITIGTPLPAPQAAADMRQPLSEPPDPNAIPQESSTPRPQINLEPIYRTGATAAHDLGLFTLRDLIGGASRDPAAAKKSLDTLYGLAQGIAGIPQQVVSELAHSHDAFSRGDITMGLNHLAGAVPFFGPLSQTITNDVIKQDWPAVGGHILALIVGGRGGAMADATARGIAATPDFLLGAVPEAVRGVMPRGLRSYAGVGAVGAIPGYLVGGYKGALAGAAISRLPGAVTRGIRGGMAAVRESVSAADLAAADAIAAAQARAAAQQAADAELARGARVYEAHERMTQPLPQITAGPIVTEPPPDTSFVRGVPAQYPEVVRPVIPPSRQLAAGPRITEMPPVPDTSFVRAVPAQLPEVTLPPPAPPVPPAMSPGQAVAAEAGLNWADLSATHRAYLEQVAGARQNVAEQQYRLVQQPTAEEQATITPAEQAPIAEMSYTAPAAEAQPQATPPQDFEAQLAESIRQVEERKQAAQAAAEAPQPTFQEKARAKKVDALFNFITNKDIPLSFVETMGKDEWRIMSGKDYADIANPPSAETIRQVKERLAAHEAAQNVPVTSTTTPAEAQAAFERNQAIRTQPQVSPEPPQQESLQPKVVQPPAPLPAEPVQPTPPAPSEPAPEQGTPQPAASVHFGKEATYSGKRQFTAYGYDAQGTGTGDAVQISRRPDGGYIVEQSYYETPPGPENRYGRTATRQIGGTYTKGEARDVAEAYLTGQPHPFADIEAGQPFSEYRAGTGKLEVPHMGFPHGTIEGEPAWTNGHVMFKGEAPGKITEQDIQMDRVWDQAKEAAQRDYQPVATYREDLRNIVVLADEQGNPVTVDAKYFDVARKRFKNAIFRASSPKEPVSVWQPQPDGTPQMVGVIAPVRLQHIENLPQGVRNILQERQPAPEAVPRPRRTRRTLKNLMEP